MPALPHAGQTRAQPLSPHLGGPALGQLHGQAVAARAQAVLRPCRLHAADLHRAAAGGDRTLGTPDGSAGQAADDGRPCPWWSGWRPSEPVAGHADHAQHAAAADPGSALASGGDTLGPRHRRLGAAQASYLRHGAGRPGATAAGSAAARPRGGDARAMVAGASGGRGRGARSLRCLSLQLHLLLQV